MASNNSQLKPILLYVMEGSDFSLPHFFRAKIGHDPKAGLMIALLQTLLATANINFELDYVVGSKLALKVLPLVQINGCRVFILLRESQRSCST